MADVNRYGQDFEYEPSLIIEREDGPYVYFEDYASLRASHSELLEAARIAFVGVRRDKLIVPEYMELLAAAIAKAERV